MNCLELLGLDATKLKQLMAWAADRLVTLWLSLSEVWLVVPTIPKTPIMVETEFPQVRIFLRARMIIFRARAAVFYCANWCP
jgi:hypothetical protein